MNGPQAPLFRKEVLERRADRLQGDVSLAVPVSWQIIGFMLFTVLVAALGFLGTASYSRTEMVAGAIVLDRGVATIVPSRPGIVAEIAAREGQQVAVGDPLVAIRSEEDMTGGRTAPRRIMEALEEQDSRLDRQTSLVMSAADAERGRLTAQISGTEQEITSIDSQTASQRRLIEIAENEFNEVKSSATKGFISRRDLGARESALIARRQQLSQLEQARAAKTASLAEGRRSIAQAGATVQAQAAGIQSSRAALAQQLAQAESARGYTLTAPIAGMVTAVTARLGQPAIQQQPLMIVMPNNATPRAEMYVPTNAAGFLEIGQEVRLAVDAFPYQRFGTVNAKIIQISSVAVPKATTDGGTISVYLVTAKLSDASVIAFGRKQPLLPGMTLTARIITEKQSLFKWLFEPLFAVNGR